MAPARGLHEGDFFDESALVKELTERELCRALEVSLVISEGQLQMMAFMHFKSAR